MILKTILYVLKWCICIKTHQHHARVSWVAASWILGCSGWFLGYLVVCQGVLINRNAPIYRPIKVVIYTVSHRLIVWNSRWSLPIILFIVLILLSCGLFPLCCANFIVVACFHCVVLISLCCSLFLLCCGDFVVLCTTGPPWLYPVNHKRPNHW